MKITIRRTKNQLPTSANSPEDTQSERFISELVIRQRAIEAEFRNFSASMVRGKTIEVIA